MRTARFSWVLLPLVFIGSPFPNPAIAADAPPDAVPQLWLPLAATLRLYDGDSIAVSYVRSWGPGVLRYETPDRSVEYLSTHKIARVVDAEGNDRTRHTLVERRSLGAPSEGPRGPAGGPPRMLDRWIVSPIVHSPTRRAKGYLITEAAALGHSDYNAIVGKGTLLSVGIGAARNLSRTWSLGGVVHFSGGDVEYRGADVGVRLRYYLSDHLSLETTQGVFTASSGENGSWETHGAAYFGESAVTLSDAVSFVVRAESAEWRRESVYGWSYSLGPSRRTERLWRVGARLGPYPRWLSIPALVAGTLMFLTPRGTVIY